MFSFLQPAGLAIGSVDKGASTKKEDHNSASNGEEMPGTIQIIFESTSFMEITSLHFKL